MQNRVTSKALPAGYLNENSFEGQARSLKAEKVDLFLNKFCCKGLLTGHNSGSMRSGQVSLVLMVLSDLFRNQLDGAARMSQSFGFIGMGAGC